MMEKKMTNNLHDEYEAIPLFNEDGSIKPKDDFMQDISDFYDSVANSAEGAFDSLCDSEEYLIPQNVLSNYDFLSRTIYITTDISPAVSKEVIRKIRFWNADDDANNIAVENRIPIKMYIDTLGGDLTATLSIISAMQLSKTPIHTITYGIGYSGGFMIGINGHKRYGFPHSSYLFHEGSAAEMGDAHKFLQHIDFYKMQLKKIKQIVVSKTKITEDEYETHKKDDWFFSVEDARHYGIIDEIIETF